MISDPQVPIIPLRSSAETAVMAVERVCPDRYVWFTTAMGWFSDLFGGTAKDEAAAQSLTAIRSRAQGENTAVVHLSGIKHDGRKGTQAWIYLERTGETRDAFFWHLHNMQVGEALLVELSVGWGYITGRSNVVYIGSEGNGPGVLQRLSAKDVQRANRHLGRQSG